MDKKNAFGFIFITALALPVLFQNCANHDQGFVPTGEASSQSLNTDSLPTNSETQLGGSVVASSDSSVAAGSTSSDGGSKSSGEKDDQESRQAIADCANYKKSKGKSGKMGSGVSEAVSGLNGKHFLTPDDFGGNTHVSCIDDAHGKLILCGLQVDEVKNVSGRLILVGSEVKKSRDCNGRIDLVSSRIQDLSSYKGSVVKH